MNSEQPKFIKNLRRSLVLMFLGFVVLIILLKFIGYGEIFRTISMINIWFILLMICVRPVSLIIYSYRVYILSKGLKGLKNTSFWKFVPIQLSGMFVNNLTPGPSVGGEPLKAYFLEKATGLRGSICFGLYTMDSLVVLFVTFFFMSISTFYLIFSISFEKLRYFLAFWFAACLIVAALLIFFIFKLSKQKKRFIKILTKLYNFRLFKFLKKYFSSADIFVKEILSKQRAFLNTLNILWKNKRALWISFFGSIVWFLLQGLGLWFLFKGMGYSISFIRLVAVMTIGLSFGYLVFVPGGTGATESSIILLMSLLGVPASAITAVIILDRAAYYIMTYFFGYISLSYLTMIYTAPGRMVKKR